MPDIDFNIDSQFVPKTEAAWTADLAIYPAASGLMISSDANWTGTDQPKFKVPDGVQKWADLDYPPIGVLGANYVVVAYLHTSTTPLADASDYFIMNTNTIMGATNNSTARTPIKGGTVREAHLNTYNAGTFGSSESSTVTYETNDGAESNVVSTAVKFNARNTYLPITSGLDWVVSDGLSWMKLDAATFATNPTAAKLVAIVVIELP